MNIISTIFLFSFAIAILVVLVYIVKKPKALKKPTVWNYQDDVIIEDKVEQKDVQVDKEQPSQKNNSTSYNPFIAMHS